MKKNKFEESEKQIKLIVSDLHFGSGNRNEDGEMNLNEDFLQDSLFVEFVNYHSSKRFHSSSVELIFNGDNFEMIDPLWYTERGEDPLKMTDTLSIKRFESIWSGHVEIFQALKQFNKNPRNSIRFLPGNHDQVLLFVKVKEWIKEQIGGVVLFSDEYYEYKNIYIEHGQQYTYITRLDPERKTIIDERGDEILNHDWTTVFSFEYVYKRKGRNFYAPYNIAPAVRAIKKGLFFETRFTIKYAIGMLLFLIRSFIAPVRKELTNSRTTLKILQELAGDFAPILEKKGKELLEEKKYKAVIFGHCHNYRYFKNTSGGVYINTGSWTDQTNLTAQNLGKWSKFPFAYIEIQNSKIKTIELREWKGIWKFQKKLFP